MKNKKVLVDIDGEFGEGGGQILRYALALSCVTKKPFLITNIRKNRSKPGLKNQHMNAIKALEQIYDIKVLGNESGSDYVEFYPKKLIKRKIDIDIKTAGSITLLLQSLILPCIIERKIFTLIIKGGTDVSFSMQYDYFANVIVPQYRRFVNIEIKLNKRGYYPKGGGEIEVVIKPLKKEIIHNHKKGEIDNEGPIEIIKNWEPLVLIKQGHFINIRGIVHASTELSKKDISERIASAATKILKRKGNVRIDSVYNRSANIGVGVTLWAIFSNHKDDVNVLKPIILGVDMIGKKDISSEKLGEDAAKKMLDEIAKGVPVDIHAQDNLIPMIAIFGGKIKVSKITNHTKSAMYVCQKFLNTDFYTDLEENIIEVINPYFKEVLDIEEL